MAGSSRYTVVLDACVLYPAPVCDALLSLAVQGLYHARWTAQITREFVSNIAKNRPDLTEARLMSRAQKMAAAIPDSQIEGYERFLNVMTLPDPKDNHVVAAAIAGHADAIVTFNLKDFPQKQMASLGIEAQHPDEFIVNQLHLNPIEALKAINTQRQRLVSPPQSALDLIQTFRRCGLPQTANLLDESIELI
jgi:predicted nucleic acid-binding protein